MYEMTRKVKAFSRESYPVFRSVRFVENAQCCLIRSLPVPFATETTTRERTRVPRSSNSPRWIMNETLCEGGRGIGVVQLHRTRAGSHTGACRRRPALVFPRPIISPFAPPPPPCLLLLFFPNSPCRRTLQPFCNFARVPRKSFSQACNELRRESSCSTSGDSFKH